MDLHLSGKSALITGASKGIGLAVAKALAAEGVNLHLASRSELALQAAADAIEEAHGVEVSIYPTDLSETVNGEALAMECGDVDILVNNAGAIPGGTLETVNQDAWRKGWDLKVFGYVNLCREMYEFMCEEPDDADETADEGETAEAGPIEEHTPCQRIILNVIGSAGIVPDASYICGSTGNAALNMFTRTLGGVSMEHGVRVLGVNPGLIETDRAITLLRAKADAQLGDADRWRELTGHLPGGGPGTVEQVADVVAFLVSDRASHISGEMIAIDGGFSSKGRSF